MSVASRSRLPALARLALFHALPDRIRRRLVPHPAILLLQLPEGCIARRWPDARRCLEVPCRTGAVADVRAQHAADIEEARQMLLRDVGGHRVARLIEVAADDAGAITLLVRHQAFGDAECAIEVL